MYTVVLHLLYSILSLSNVK